MVGREPTREKTFLSHLPSAYNARRPAGHTADFGACVAPRGTAPLCEAVSANARPTSCRGGCARGLLRILFRFRVVARLAAMGSFRGSVLARLVDFSGIT